MVIIRNYSNFLKSFNSKKFKDLWPAQGDILEKYVKSKFMEKSDVAIELPTGGGKTLIALLIAEAWRRENKKVAILSANKTLARQMKRETEQLGIPAVLMEGKGIDIPASDKRAYQRTNKIALMNYWVYFNQNPVVDNADLLIMDDAHLAEHCLHSLWSVEISRNEHNNLFIDLITELINHFPEYAILQDALEGNSSSILATELLSFIEQINISDRFREIIDSSPSLELDRSLRYSWKRMRNSLNEVNIYLSLNSIWFRPCVYPLINNSQYRDATQRLYMSATIGEPSDLSRRLGIKKIEKIPVPQKFSETTIGRRLIVMNRIEDEDLPERLQVAIIAALRKCPKSVWLCTSKAEAEKYKQVISEWLNESGLIGHPTWVLSNLGNEIDSFKKAKAGHLFVGGRFDGMDFHDNECRLVILTTLPRAINIQEEFFCGHLRDAGFMKRRLNHRIIQALGRCNRSKDDYAIYILADRRFATHFGRESNRAGIPKNIMAEIDMAEDMAEEDVAIMEKKIVSFIDGDFSHFDTAFKNSFANVPNITSLPASADFADDEVLGWAAMFDSQNYSIATQKFEDCWKKTSDANFIELGAYYKWCWAKAKYLDLLQRDIESKEEALVILEEAITRGGQSAWFNRMKASLNRARNLTEIGGSNNSDSYAQNIFRYFDELLEQLGTRGNRFQQWCNRLGEDLQSNNHDQFCQGLERLGKLLGYDAIRPKHRAATDCRWRGIFGNCKELITFEAKIQDDPSESIIASDIGQVHNQIARAKQEFLSLGYTIRGSIVTHLSKIKSDAESSAGSIRIISKNAIIELWEIIKQLLVGYRESWSIDDIKIRMQAAEAIRHKLPPNGWLIKVLDSDQRIISSEMLLNAWNSR